MRGAVAGCVLLACLAALLTERTEGHITFFSPKEMMLMKVSGLCWIGQCSEVGLRSWKAESISRSRGNQSATVLIIDFMVPIQFLNKKWPTFPGSILSIVHRLSESKLNILEYVTLSSDAWHFHSSLTFNIQSN